MASFMPFFGGGQPAVQKPAQPQLQQGGGGLANMLTGRFNPQQPTGGFFPPQGGWGQPVQAKPVPQEGGYGQPSPQQPTGGFFPQPQRPQPQQPQPPMQWRQQQAPNRQQWIQQHPQPQQPQENYQRAQAQPIVKAQPMQPQPAQQPQRPAPDFGQLRGNFQQGMGRGPFQR